jgi:DNA-binding NarL/FixJ family response regulator
MLRNPSDLEVVGEARNGAEAVALVRKFGPDVVLMDLRMPEMDGATAVGKIKAERPETQILILTSYATDADIFRAIEKGATGYLLKDASAEMLVEAIRQAAAGRSLLSPPVATRLVQRVRGNEEENLSEREIEILRSVALGMNNRDVARALLISESTVKAHLIRIYDKLGVDDRTAAVTTAIRRGIIRLDP